MSPFLGNWVMLPCSARYDIVIPTLTAFRKAIATSVAKSGTDEDVRLIASQMTHKKHYQSLKTSQGAAKAHKLISEVTMKEGKEDTSKKRRKFTGPQVYLRII